MKKYIAIFLVFVLHFGFAQGGGFRIDINSTLFSGGINNAQLLLNETENDFARIRLTNSLYDPSSNNRFWDIAAKIGTNSANDLLNFYSRGSGTNILSLRGDGRVGVLTSQPSAAFEVNGYTKLGKQAPKIKMKKLTGDIVETGSSQFVVTDIPFVNKILAVDIFVFNESSGYSYPPGVNYNYRLWVDIEAEQELGGENHRISLLDLTNSVRGQPYTILITYEE